jgi:hypothetical protein
LHQSPLVYEAEIAKSRNELAVHLAAESAVAKREVETHQEDEDYSATQKERTVLSDRDVLLPALVKRTQHSQRRDSRSASCVTKSISLSS